MKKIQKWLQENNIEFIYSSQRRNYCIEIILEKDCIWINGFGQPMQCNKSITISYDTYKIYGVYEHIGYSLSKKLIISKRADTVIDILAERFERKD